MIKSLVHSVNKRARKLRMRGEEKLRYLTAPIRPMPDFLIIGTQKGGTTSLYDCLIQHPCVLPARVKEVRFFSRHFDRGTAWYRTHFPTSSYRFYAKMARGQDLVTGEATPYYIFHPHAPRRILETLPRAKLIALLRNPVDRAYSHYQHVVRKGRETLSFEEAMEAEPERLRIEREKIMKDENHRGFYGFYSYLTRGGYADQLEVWFSLFPREQILILNSETFFADPSTTFKQVLAFLNLPGWELKEHAKSKVGSYPEMNPATRKKLVDYFAPHNQRLYELIGQQYQWE